MVATSNKSVPVARPLKQWNIISSSYCFVEGNVQNPQGLFKTTPQMRIFFVPSFGHEV